MRIFKILAAVVVALALSCGAVMANNLDLTNFTWNNIPFNNGTLGGGSFTGAKLDGVTLDWVYCLQSTVHIYPGYKYDQTIVTNDGKINNVSVTNAGRVAYLLDTYANGADKNTQIALQAAIWNITGQGNLNADAPQIGLYNSMINSQGVGNVGNYLWLTPGKNGSNLYQGLVTRVPDGGMTLMLLGGALAGLETLRRRLRA